MVRNPWATRFLRVFRYVLKKRATRGIQWVEQRAATPRGEANPQIHSQFGLRVATHPHEVGMASNRRSSSCGECVPAPCTHRPSSHPNVFSVRPRLLPDSNRKYVRRAKSFERGIVQDLPRLAIVTRYP